MNEFLFHQTGKRRNRNERLYDLLITARNGLIKTRIMYGANLSWETTVKLIKSAEAAGLIEEFEAPHGRRYWKNKPTMIWKTTKKGLKYAESVHDESKSGKEDVVMSSHLGFLVNEKDTEVK